MNNEPVAWMSASGSFNKKETWIFHIPLYTHPAKTLTDEEINSEAKYFCYGWYSQNPERLVLFARAILRKAQEK
jgi:hypothetical protein